MKIVSKKITALLLLGFVVLNGCEKSDTPVKEVAVKDINVAREELRAKLALERKDRPFQYMFDVNLPGKGFYGDLEGNLIDLSKLRLHRELYDCPDPSDDYFSQAVTAIGSEYTCGQGYRVEVTYEVSVLYNLVGANPSNSSQLTKGKLRLKNSGGTVVWSNVNVTPVTITNLGTDPSDATLTLFRLVFKTDYIADATFSSAASVEPSLFCYTDCSLVPTINIGYSPQQAVATTNINYLPCLRVDEVLYSPTTNAVSGCNATPSSCVPFGYVFPDKQEIHWYDGSAWQILNLTFLGTNLTTGLIDPVDLWYIDIANNSGMSTGTTYQFRYRNKQISGTGSPCTSDIWVVENWQIL